MVDLMITALKPTKKGRVTFSFKDDGLLRQNAHSPALVRLGSGMVAPGGRTNIDT